MDDLMIGILFLALCIIGYIQEEWPIRFRHKWKKWRGTK
jgi:hypothetical protein